MSLELALEKNTAAIEKLIAILANPQAVVAVTEEAEAPAEAPKAKRTKKEAKPEAPVGEPVAEQPAPSPETGASDASETEAAAAPAKQVTYTEASAAVVKVANQKGRAAAVAVLAKFGAKTLGEVKASRYGDVIAACEAAL